MNAAPAPSSRAGGWRDFFDLLTDAVVVLDARSRVAFVNTAALRLLPAVAGLTLEQLTPTLGDAAVRWLALACQGQAGVVAPPLAVLNDGRHAEIAWRILDAEHSALRLTVVVPSSPHRPPAVANATPAPSWPAVLGAEGLRETLRIVWESPFPAMLQDEAFRIVDVNDAFIAFTGFARERLVGTDPISLYPKPEWAQTMARRDRLRASDGRSPEPVLMDGRLLDTAGRELCFRLARRTLIGPQGELRYLAVFQDATAEHVASERADRSLREIDDWFALSPVGMVLFDDAGLLLRTNATFDAIVGSVPASLADASPALRELLAWGDGLPELPADAASVQRQGPFTTPQGAVRALRSTVRHYRTASGQRRYMAVLEDRSVEQERDLAQLQIGTLMDAAGVGLATFQGATDRPQPGPADSPGAVPDATGGVDERAGGQGRSEQLLHELSTILESTTAGIAYLRGAVLVRCNRRFEAMLGLPAELAPGTNVSLLFGRYAPAKRMAFDALQSLTEGVIYETEFELEAGALGPASTPRWYALSVRRVGPVSGAMEAIAVLSDVSRLKAQAQELPSSTPK